MTFNYLSKCIKEYANTIYEGAFINRFKQLLIQELTCKICFISLINNFLQ